MQSEARCGELVPFALVKSLALFRGEKGQNRKRSSRAQMEQGELMQIEGAPSLYRVQETGGLETKDLG